MNARHIPFALVPCLGLLWGATLVAAVAACVLPGFGEATRDLLGLRFGGLEPALGSVGQLVANNFLVCAWPAALARFAVDEARGLGVAGDVVVAASLAANGILVGMAAGAYGARLIPYLVHLPFEWLALAVGAACWLAKRRACATRRQLAGGCLAVFALVTAAALLEVFATPHGG